MRKSMKKKEVRDTYEEMQKLHEQIGKHLQKLRYQEVIDMWKSFVSSPKKKPTK